MAGLELIVVVVAFGAMAVLFGLQERAERRRLLAQAQAVLAQEGSFDTEADAEPAARDRPRVAA
jgi:hypothetical protein